MALAIRGRARCEVESTRWCLRGDAPWRVGACSMAAGTVAVREREIERERGEGGSEREREKSKGETRVTVAEI